jgi:hypothetical protein
MGHQMGVGSMRALLFVLVFLSASAFAGEPTASDRGAIRQVIEGQMSAFRQNDAAGAFNFAAPGIQAMFGTPENFIRMVETGYPPVYRPREVEFRDLVVRDDLIVQKVLVVGPDGRPVMALYTMELQPDGKWRIAGCRLVEVDERST